MGELNFRFLFSFLGRYTERGRFSGGKDGLIFVDTKSHKK